jgi:GT2 family glycosyltransferase/glycosyltransferase involved in cell wall biosynthesis
MKKDVDFTDRETLRYLCTPELDALFWRPRRTGALSGWWGHVPFAHWIVGAAGPHTLVELGTHNGVSYSAFCEAVLHNGLDTRCYAVDTWKGDDHAGYYGEEVYLDWRRFHDERYGAFSELLRCTFDEALGYFSDASVDFLHIDGLHTYEAVRHDFENWRPKLSDSAVVLLHDTNVREGDFGVRHLWEDLHRQFPSFEFLHGYGLGVLAIGRSVSPEVAALCSLADPARESTIRRRFSLLGDLLDQRELLQNQELPAREKRIRLLEAHAGRVQAELNRSEAQLAEKVREAQDWHRQLVQRNEEHDALVAAHQTLSSELTAVRQRLQSILGSASWRLTGPLRDLADRHPALISRAQRFLGSHPQICRVIFTTAKFAWRAATLPLACSVTIRPHPVSQSAIDVAAEVERAANKPHPLPQPKAGEEQSSRIAKWVAQRRRLVDDLRQRLALFLASGDRLTFPKSESADVSVIIVLFNQAHFTLHALRAVLSQTQVKVEVILVDNSSMDETSELLEQLDNVCIVRNQDNVGFLTGVNQGAAKATGRAILLLNSDAFPRANALSVALRTLDSDANIGAVGGRILLPSGELQEAGSIIWNDASTLGYGRGLPAEAGEAMFRREVDYCSGAFLMTHRAVFERLGGFDHFYSPAYYEEADYCLRLWQAGLRVVYEPSAVVDHYEYGSQTRYGDAKSLCLRNRKRLRLRHAATLMLRHLPPSEVNVLFARDHARSRRRLLVIDNEVPFTWLGSGYPRMSKLLNEAVAEGWSVTLYPVFLKDIDWRAVHAELSAEIEICNGRGGPGMASFLCERKGYYDAVIISRPHNMALFREAVRHQPEVVAGARLIYDAEALFASRAIRQAELRGSPLPADEADALIDQELELTSGVDAVATVTVSEARLFHARQAAPVYVLGYAPRVVSDTPDFSQRTKFLFMGRLLEKNSSNYEGLSWFIRTVWPTIYTTLGQVTLTVVGALHPEPSELIAPGVALLGVVEDVHQLFFQARVFVAPVRFAAGVPIKILDATAAGLPSITTGLMATLLNWEPGIDLEATDDPIEMAKAAIALYSDPTRWKVVRAAALIRLAREHSEIAFRNGLRALLEGTDPVETGSSVLKHATKPKNRAGAIIGRSGPVPDSQNLK